MFRYGLRSFIKHGESDSVDLEVVSNGREHLQKITSAYRRQDIYNMDETALFYKLQPCQTLATSSVNGQKLSKDRITIALCMNADGSDKLKPIIINKSKRPRSFGKVFNPHSICSYYHNPKAWMNMIVFKDWLLKQNQRFKQMNGKVLLLVDNATGHNISEDVSARLTNIKLEYLPANTTSHIQPADAGIIKSFKCHYLSR